jgi:DNA-binding NarL/FixJ family response regulator
MLRVGVLSDDRLFCAGLLRLLEGETGFTVVDQAPGAPASTADRPDVLLLDSRMEGALGLCAAQKREGGPAVILVSAPDEDSWAPEALGAGARGILPKSACAADLVKAVRVVHDEGLIWARRRVIVAWLDRLTAAAPARGGGADNDALDKRLSSRERDVFRHAAAGLGNRELAQRLAISEATVKVHLTRIFQKLGLRGRGELAAAYHGVIGTPPDSSRRTPAAGGGKTRGTSRVPLPLRRTSYD